MRSHLPAILGCCFLSFSCSAKAQTIQTLPSSPPRVTQQVPGYPVTGRVICADTQRPARFAQVMLVPAATGTGDFDRGRMAVGRTDLDGRFTIQNVPAGDYYATAEMTGYIDDAPAVRLGLSQGGDALAAIAAVPRVQVTSGGATAQISLQRGAIIAGSVQWDDGSPAAGVQIGVQTPSSASVSMSAASGNGFNRQSPFAFPGGGSGQTDDRGRFRLSGLAPGSYVVRASVQSPMPVMPGEAARFQRLVSLSVYAPNKLRKADATVVTLSAGEERPEVNIILGLGGMHTVSGQVTSSGATVRSGSVQIVDQTDETLNRRGTIGADGSFAIPYVPPGTYTLRVNASAQAQNVGRDGGSGGTVPRFQPVQESITVTDGDLTGLNVSVTPATGTP